MKAVYEIKEKNYLIFALVAIVSVIIFANFLDESITIIVGNWIYTPITLLLVILSIKITIRNRLVGNLGKSWLLFTVATVCWFVAEHIWTVYELIYELDPFPSEADIFWLVGYSFFFAFFVLYLQPIRKAISKNMVLYASLISLSLFVVSFYVGYVEESELTDMQFIIGILYPIFDVIILIPVILGMFLFFRGEVSLLWTLFFFGILSDIIANTLFLFFSLDSSYYTGHPIEILFLCSYVLFIFGVYHHIALFETKA